MGSISTYKNQSVMIDLQSDYRDNGWSISRGKAVHSGCNSGPIEKSGLETVPGTSYTIEFEVEAYSSGGVNVIAGGAAGATVTAAGRYEHTLTALDDSGIVFFSDGNLTVSLVKISSGNRPALTFAFNENANKWVTYYSYTPEFMLKFINSFYCFKNGELWEQNTNETRNNFFGVQYSSKVRFISNVEHQKEKLWYNIRLDSKGAWMAPQLLTQPNDLFPNGMESRLKKGNFKSVDGKLWADILRDKNDPAYAAIEETETRELAALFKGRKLQGGYLVVELECADTTEAKLASAEVYYTEIERSL